MPVKDGEAYIEEAVRSVQTQALRDWELVVVDDHSRDGTGRLVAALAASDARVRLVGSPGHGQVQAINHGYGFCRGESLKIMDADDLLAPCFSDDFPRLRTVEASYHDALLLDGRLGGRKSLRVGARFERMGFEQSLRRIMVSPPRWSWTLTPSFMVSTRTRYRASLSWSSRSALRRQACSCSSSWTRARSASSSSSSSVLGPSWASCIKGSSP
jgi:glycosyltransferase involved in cell wall biosynthesis